ncbi:MAG: bifunctional hydroxymethylpyrimidine kinase/phosphomethylpyrimidine kinase [Acidimicrobiales bacterium]|nr:bifunctional hydroxymethylpyrimidine kinase/phosphomethylpyrimidine kinase [Acidimicrobiales bacterium]
MFPRSPRTLRRPDGRGAGASSSSGATPRVALTVAGSDSAGGAGIQADLRTFAALGVHGASAIAAVTAQSTRAVAGVDLVPVDFVVRQIESVTDDLDVAAVKTGFLGEVGLVAALARLVDEGRLPAPVVDPVLVTSTGARMFDPALEAAYLEHLLPRTRVATPNRVEAGLLLGRPVNTVDDMATAAADLLDIGPEVVVVKGGDAADEGDRAVDVVASGTGVERLELPLVDTDNDHGSGCSFAAATAAGLALGHDPLDAVRAAKQFVHEALEGAAGWRLGAGHGPIDHFGWTSRR